MAWSTPLTASASSPLTASQWNASVRDNLNETAPAKFTASGQFFASTGANAGAARTPGRASDNSVDTTTSTSFTDLASAGPALTVTSGSKALIAIHCRLVNNTAGAISSAGWAVSGATTLAASDDLAVAEEASAASDNAWQSGVWLFTGLNAGSNTFTMKYKVSAGTGSFGARSLSIIPF